jgi:hypothetical protein
MNSSTWGGGHECQAILGYVTETPSTKIYIYIQSIESFRPSDNEMGEIQKGCLEGVSCES